MRTFSPAVQADIANFHAHIVLVKSTATAEKYKTAAERFHTFLSLNGLSIDALPPGVLSIFGESLIHDGCRPATARTLMSGVNAYLNWCRNRGRYIAQLGKADLPKIVRLPPNVLPRDQIVRYLAAASRVHEPIRTALLLLPFCGLRSKELCSLRTKDISRIHLPATPTRPEQHVVAFSFFGKGQKYRTVPLLSDGVPILIKYLKGWRRQVRQTSPYLFPMREGPMTDRTLRGYVHAIARRIGADRLHPHTLRRTYLTTLHKHGIDIPTLAKIAGHASIQTTMDHYLAIEKESVAGAVAGLHLVERGPHADRMAAARIAATSLLSSTADGRVFDVPEPPPIEEADL